MKEWYTAEDLAGLPSMPNTARRVRSKAQRESWDCQKKAFGKGYEFHISHFPKDACHALQEQHRLSLLKKMVLKPVGRQTHSALVTPNQGTKPTHRQRETAASRLMILRAIQGMVDEGISQESAITTLLTQAELGLLSQNHPVLERALAEAVDPRGHAGKDKNYPSRRTIMRWLGGIKNHDTLVPKKREKAPLPTWLDQFRCYYSVPEKPSLNAAYEIFKNNWVSTEPCPSVYAVRRAMDKLGKVEREKGRMGRLELANLKTFTRRTFDKLLPCDVYSADGHTFDGEVSHPLHGRPFRPEITTFIDIATRRVVGVSVTLAESGMAVLDALMDSCKTGVPALLYVDNGSGYVNHMLKDEAKGVLARLGVEMTHSLPYNSKARGVIERVHQTLWVSGAKMLPNYIGKDMDRQARLANFKTSRKALKEEGVMGTLSWSDFMSWIKERVEWYNKRPHASLPKIGDQGVRRHESPLEAWQRFRAEGWEAQVLSNEDIAHIFRPQVERTVLRGEIRLFNQRYFSKTLEEWHGCMVHVAYDIQDANQVWVFEPQTGRFITHADFAANETDYFPQAVIERAREKRAQGRLQRALIKVEEIEAERTGNMALEHQSRFVLEGFQTQVTELVPECSNMETVRVKKAKPAYEGMEPKERYRLYLDCQQDDALAQEHTRWLANYPKSKEYRYFTHSNQEEASWTSYLRA